MVGIFVIVFFVVIVGLLIFCYKKIQEQEISEEGGELIGEEWKNEGAQCN